MSEHVSDFALDGMLTGQSGLGMEAHLAVCGACSERLEILREHRSRTVAAAPFVQLERTLRARRAPIGRWAWYAAASVAGLVCVLAVTARPGEATTRVKGGPSLTVTRRDGNPSNRLQAGERVAVSLVSAGHPYALIEAVDDHGEVSQLWPVDGDDSGVVTARAGRLEPEFEVTRGSFALFAFLSKEPLSGRLARQALAVAVAQVSGRSPDGRLPLDALPDPVRLPGESARVRSHFWVSAEEPR
jgi:hypothetical protein